MAKPSRLSRLARLGGLTSQVSASYVGQRVKSLIRGDDPESLRRAHIENAARIAEAMSRLKGAAMKVGQQLAVAASSMDLPPEVASVLGKLHAEAEPVPFAIIREDIEASLERPLSEVFAHVDPTPLGTASLGQAHAARLIDGAEVVVKVLHRGVDHDVATDLLALKAALVSARALGRERAELDAWFDEIRARLEEEVDYLNEAKNLLTFQRLWRDDPGVRIPTVYPALSSERVLVLDRLPGVPIERFLATATPEARLRAAEAIARLYFDGVYRHRTLHADPHPGNYLFEPDGRVGLLDYGCVKTFDPFFVAHYARGALAGVAGDKAACLDACRDLEGLVGHSREAGDALWAFVDTIAGPFRVRDFEIGGPHDDLLDRIAPIVKEIAKHPEVKAPADLIMMHRAFTGMYVLVRRLRVALDPSRISEPAARHAIEVAARLGRGEAI